MMTIDEALRNKLISVVDATRAMYALLQKHTELSPDLSQQLAYCCAETALLALTAADELEASNVRGPKLLRRELASALRHITDHLLLVQEWQSAEEMQIQIQPAYQHTVFISNAAELPSPQPTQEAAEELSLLPVVQPLETPAEAERNAAPESDDEEKLLAEIQALREALTSLLIERDRLVLVECKELEAAYLSEFGALNAEIYEADGELRYLRRKLEMLQAEANRSKQADPEAVEATLKIEYEAFKKAFEDFVHKVYEAERHSAKRRAEAEQQPQSAKETKEKKDRARKLKKLYRDVVKAMHPDLHPNQDEQTKDLFKRAILAYKDGDLKTLSEISGALGAEGSIGAAYRLEELRREKRRLLTMIRSVQVEIQTVKSKYPYTKKELLEDPGRLEQEKTALRSLLEQLKQSAEELRAHIRQWEETTWET